MKRLEWYFFDPRSVISDYPQHLSVPINANKYGPTAYIIWTHILSPS